MNSFMRLRPLLWGVVATSVLLMVYGAVVSLVSGTEFAGEQFREFWYFIVSLAVGFGIQIGLYSYLRQEVRSMNMRTSGRTVAVTGTTSTIAMISCCAHYLANIVPILGIAGALTIIGQYQKELFWVGLVFNAGGIIYIARKVYQFRRRALMSSRP